MKSGLASILPPESRDLLHHFLGGREPPFGTNFLLKAEVETAVVLGVVAEDPDHDNSFGHGRIVSLTSHRPPTQILAMARRLGPDLALELASIFPDLKWIFMSGYTRDTDPAIVLGRGVPFVQKPFQPMELGRLIRAVLNC